MTSTCPTAANHFHWRTPACSILKYSGIPTAECQLCPGLIPSSACVVGRSWGLESCCAAPHWEQGRTLQSQGPRVPRAGHRIPGKHKHRDQPNTATGPSLPSAEILHESQHREQVRPALSHSCAVSTDTDPGRVLSIPSRPCQHHEAPRALPQGSSSPLLLTFSKPLQQGCPHSRGSSLQERPSWCTGAHPGCETLLRSQPPSFPPQSSGSSSRLCSGDTGAGHSASTELPRSCKSQPNPEENCNTGTGLGMWLSLYLKLPAGLCSVTPVSAVVSLRPAEQDCAQVPEYPLLRLECDFCSKWGLNVLLEKGIFKFWISAFGHFKPAEIYTIYSSVNIYNMH